MGQLGILNGQDVLLHGRETFCGEGKGLCSARKGMQAKDGAGDYSERSKGARNQFRQIVAGDIFHHFAAAAGERSIRKSDGNADDEVAERAEAQPQRAAVATRRLSEPGTARRFSSKVLVFSMAVEIMHCLSSVALGNAGGFQGMRDVLPRFFAAQSWSRKNFRGI